MRHIRCNQHSQILPFPAASPPLLHLSDSSTKAIMEQPLPRYLANSTRIHWTSTTPHHPSPHSNTPTSSPKPIRQRPTPSPVTILLFLTASSSAPVTPTPGTWFKTALRILHRPQPPETDSNVSQSRIASPLSDCGRRIVDAPDSRTQRTDTDVRGRPSQDIPPARRHPTCRPRHPWTRCRPNQSKKR